MAKITFDSITFSNASTRYLGPYPNTIEDVLGGFAANTPATVTGTFDGSSRTGMQIEGSRTNKHEKSNTLDTWAAEEMGVSANDSGTDDPLGTETSEELTPTTANASHRVYEYATNFNVSSTNGVYAFSIFAKYNGYDLYVNLYHADSVDDSYILYDLDAISYSIIAGIINAGIDEVDDSWVRGWFTRTLDENANYNWPRTRLNAYSGGIYFAGDGASGFWAWQAQLELGYWPSSIIINSGTGEATRAADNAYWAAGSVPSALRGLITLYVIPQFSSEQLYDADTVNTILHFDDATQDIRVYFEQGTASDTGRIVVYGASALCTTGNLTWSRGQLLKITLNPATGDVTTTLFTTGNGTADGTAWSTDDGNVYLGQSASNTDYFFGVIFEPEYEAAETANHAAMMMGCDF
jgi:hypothetical protein